MQFATICNCNPLLLCRATRRQFPITNQLHNGSIVSVETQPSPSQTPQEILKQYWGYDAFRPLQREAIECALSTQDSVVVLPTGGGKSLCYQIPALCKSQVAVVVSPLISLMKDQVDGLNASGIAAASINSALSDHEKRQVANEVETGQLQLLYMAPERLVIPSTIEFLQRVGVAFFAIDEAHCISSWGHDFRPEYRKMGELKQHFPGVSVHAFTATATQRVRADIAKQLNLTGAETLVGSFDRENLLYRVHRRGDTLAQVREVIDRHSGDSGIVYCISRKEVEDVAATLNGLGYKAKPYHAGLSPVQRTTHQDDFINERTDIIVATVAFGMGIDKSNVRFVVHAGMPKSLEAYQQESGRAGRDGLQSECTLLYSGSDLMMWKRMQSDPTAGSGELLEAMYGYCTRNLCRHRMLVEYFGQAFEKADCGACDVCLNELASVLDSLIVSQKIISCVHRVNQRFGVGHVTKVLTGSEAARIAELGHDKLSTYGLLADQRAATVSDWIGQLVGQGFLAKSGEYSVLVISETGRAVLRGETTPSLVHNNSAPKQSARVDDWEGVDRDLFELLRTKRKDLAAEKSVPPFVIFHDASLRDMAKVRPSTLDAFEKVSGVGQKKQADYGEVFVSWIVEYCQQHDVPTDQRGAVQPTLSAKSKMTNKAKEDSFQLFAQGQSIAQVAPQIDRALSTTSQYLSDYITQHHVADPSPWIDAVKAQTIRDAINEVGELERLSPIKESLGDEFSYEEIRVVVDCLKVETGFSTL